MGEMLRLTNLVTPVALLIPSRFGSVGCGSRPITRALAPLVLNTWISAEPEPPLLLIIVPPFRYTMPVPPVPSHQ